MSTLKNKKIKDTYEGLLKTSTNLALDGTLTQIQDGTGQDSNVKINNLGDIELNKLKFTTLEDSNAVEINDFLTSTEPFESELDTKIPTVKAVKNYVDSEVTLQDLDFSGNTGTGDVDLDSDVFTITGSNGIETTALGASLIIDGSILETDIANNTQNISDLEDEIQDIQEDVQVNATNIATNVSNITSNTNEIAANVGAISLNSNDISTNAGDINTNANNIATNVTNIATNATDIANIDTSGIAINAANIATNTTNIATNVSDIATNLSNITSNEGRISSNETDILVNAQNIQDAEYDIINNYTDIVTINSTAEFLVNKGQPSGYVPLDANSKILETYLPANTGDQNLAEVLSLDNTTNGNDIAISANDDITLTSTSKIIFSSLAQIESLKTEIGDLSNTALGNNSLATGLSTLASGSISTAMGFQTTASASFSTAIGGGTTASGISSTAMGLETTASGWKSTAMGDNTTASGDNSTSIGNSTTADGYGTTAVGSFNTMDAAAVPTTFDAANRAFVVGIGTDTLNLEDAFTVKYDGTTYSTQDATFNKNVIVEGNLFGNVIVVNGLVNNLASQGSGGYDFMEWTSNVTGTTQIPLWRNPSAFEIVAITFAWIGDTALSIGAGEQVDFEIGYITNNTSAKIANFNTISNLFTIDSTYNGLFASGEVEFATPISLTKYQNLAIIGTELGTVTPNNGELSISLLLRHIP